LKFITYKLRSNPSFCTAELTTIHSTKNILEVTVDYVCYGLRPCVE